MLWFLIALLRRDAPTRRWVVPTHKRELKVFDIHGGDYTHKRWRLTTYSGSHFGAEFLENQNHDKEKYGSGLIILDSPPVSKRVRSGTN